MTRPRSRPQAIQQVLQVAAPPLPSLLLSAVVVRHHLMNVWDIKRMHCEAGRDESSKDTGGLAEQCKGSTYFYKMYSRLRCYYHMSVQPAAKPSPASQQVLRVAPPPPRFLV